MRRSNGRHRHTRSQRTGKKTSFSYSDEQREVLRHGLRILARLIVRTHMRRQSLENQTKAVSKKKNPAS